MKKIIYICLIVLFLPDLALAYTEVVNNINTLASTGNNKTENSEVVAGKSSTEVKVYTEINGEVVENIDKKIDNESNFEFESKKSSENSSVETKVKVGVEKPVLQEMPKTNIETQDEIPLIASNGEERHGFFKKMMDYIFSIFKF